MLCLFLLLACLLTSCMSNGNQTDGTADTGDNSQPNATTLQIIKEGKSDFAILFDGKDESAKAFASYLQTEIYRACEVMIPTREQTYLSEYEKRILVGITKAEESTLVASKTPVGGFSVSAESTSLSLYADGLAGYYLLENYVVDTLLASAQKHTWEVPFGLQSADDNSDVTTIKADGKTVYHLVYPAEDENARDYATRAVAYIMSVSNVKMKTGADTGSYENELLFGKVNRGIVSRIEKYVSEKDIVSGVFGDDYLILSDDRLGLVFGLMNLVEKVNDADSKNASIGYKQNLCTNLSSLPKDDYYAEAVANANDFYGTYSGLVEEALESWVVAGKAAKADQDLIDALIERMGNSLALCVGSSSALHNGFIVKLDSANYGKTTKTNAQGQLFIAKEYAEKYFGKTLDADADGYVNITAYCDSVSDYSLYYDSTSGLAVVTPKNVTNFLRPDMEINGYKNSEYLTRMLQFFNNPARPEPSVNTEQSRVVVESVELDPKYVFDYYNDTYETLYTPALCSHVENGRTILYAAYEISTRSGGKESAVITVLKKSDDGGKTWMKIGEVEDLRWASIFALNGKIYLLGNRLSNGRVLLVEYLSGEAIQVHDLGYEIGGGSSNSVAIANGKIYKAFNNAVLSASVGANLKNSTAWTVSESPQDLVSEEWFEQKTELEVKDETFWIEEGNVVVSPNGEIYVMYRLDASPAYGYAALFKLAANGVNLSLETSSGGLVKFPYSQSKFSLQYDSQTNTYLSLTSLATANYVNQRNVLGLVTSKDLIHWEIAEVLISDREMMNDNISMWAHGFQYVDFTIADGNIYFLVREAIGETVSFHEANHITFYTIENYSKMVQ